MVGVAKEEETEAAGGRGDGGPAGSSEKFPCRGGGID